MLNYVILFVFFLIQVTVEGLVARATSAVDFDDDDVVENVVESLEQICGEPSSVGVLECTSQQWPMVLVAIMSCLLSALITYICLHSSHNSFHFV